MEDVRYPIGKLVKQPFSADQKNIYLHEFAALSNKLEAAIKNLSVAQLRTPYREDGWQVHQVVHHIADVDLVYCHRIATALIEDNPNVANFNDKAWAALPYVQAASVGLSVQLVQALRARFVYTFEALTEAQWGRTMIHPKNGTQQVWDSFVVLVWHGNHHLAHITSLKKRMHW